MDKPQKHAAHYRLFTVKSSRLISIGTFTFRLQIGRQKLPKDWRKKLHLIKSKVAEATQALPPDVRPAHAEADGPLDYLEVRDVRDALAAGTAERSLFGGLTGNASVWDKLVRAYEREGASHLPSHAHTHMPCCTACSKHEGWAMLA
jgi:hypothetical protein